MATDNLEFLPPSIDPAHRQSIYGTIRFIVDKMVKQDMDNMLPGKVIAVDRVKNRVTVELMVSMINTARQVVKRAQIASIPIYQPSAGGYVINLPVQEGDLGWVKTTDTDISLFLQTLNSTPVAQPPNTFITHKFDSSLFYPDEMNVDVTIAEEDADNLVIQKNDGTVKISLSEDQVKISAPTKVLIDTPLLEVTGEVKSNLNGGIELSTHRHDGVMPGGGTTGEPIP